MGNKLYGESLTNKDKFDKSLAIIFLMFLIGLVIFGYHWMFREYTTNPDEFGGVEGFLIYGVISFLLILYFYKKKFTRDFYKEIVEIYDDRLIINRTISKSVFPKEDIDKVYMINWNLPPSFQRFNPGKRVMGFAVDKKDGDHYYTKEKPKHVIDKILVEIEKHWGEDYVGETVNKDMGW